MEKITLTGTIYFEPEDKTKKHLLQSSWKKVAMVIFDGDLCEYYSWFINRRFNLKLNRPLRGAHITFINDSMKDLTHNNTKSEIDVNTMWETVKDKYHKTNINVTIGLSPHTNGEHFWLIVPHEDRDELQAIRNELGLNKPFFGLHMSLGYANLNNIHHAKYIGRLLEKGF